MNNVDFMARRVFARAEMKAGNAADIDAGLVIADALKDADIAAYEAADIAADAAYVAMQEAGDADERATLAAAVGPLQEAKRAEYIEWTPAAIAPAVIP